MIYFTAHTFKCVCHCRMAMFRVLGMYNFAHFQKIKCFKDQHFQIHFFIKVGLLVQYFSKINFFGKIPSNFDTEKLL